MNELEVVAVVGILLPLAVLITAVVVIAVFVFTRKVCRGVSRMYRRLQ